MLELNQSSIAERALTTIGAIHEIERATAEATPAHRQQVHEQQARPVITAFHAWLMGQRAKLTRAMRTTKAIDYALKRREALTGYSDDRRAPINNWVGSQIRLPLGEDTGHLHALYAVDNGRAM